MNLRGLDLDRMSEAQLQAVASQFDRDGNPTGLGVPCARCGLSYPPDDDHYHFKDGRLTQPCKECRRQLKRRREERDLLQARTIALATVGPEMLDKVIHGQLEMTPGLEEILAEIMRIFNGKEGIAKLMFNEFTAAPAGKMVRFQYLKYFMEIAKAVEAIRQAERNRHDQLSDEDLQIALQNAVAKLSQQPKSLPSPEPDDVDDESWEEEE